MIPHLKDISELRAWRQSLKASRERAKPHIAVGAGSGCLACGAQEILEECQKEIDRRGWRERIEVRSTGCHGFCERGPLVVIRPADICYMGVRAEDVSEIVSKTVGEGKLARALEEWVSIPPKAEISSMDRLERGIVEAHWDQLVHLLWGLRC